MAETSHVLEINLISAQGLTESSAAGHGRIKTYAVAWVDSSTKLRTRVDRLGGHNPTWNDKFLFKVSSEFLLSKTSAVSVEIYAAGMFRDRLIGCVRLLVSTFLETGSASFSSMKTPAFVARLIRSPSGEFFGTLNVGAMVIDGSGFQSALSKVSGIDYRDLTGEKQSRLGTKKSKDKVKEINGDQSEISNGNSLISSSSSVDLPTVLKELSLTNQKNNEEEDGPSVALETSMEEQEKDDEICGVGSEKSLEEIANMIWPNEGISMEKMEKDVEIVMEEVKEQWTVISDLKGRVKSLEKRLSRKNKPKKGYNGKSNSATMSYVGAIQEAG
ncbi:C2 calcium-dependent membrane targeting [Corchorus capsularis]|uniref:C2 calcium-dependent membrane targeting n=1 Tax=Corchorus capsularis TaxID=210143 RepID=A0A1R3IS37_COCAP|nr:C2 calcium-dependent membrane targeting [Corchorus capsularis]